MQSYFWASGCLLKSREQKFFQNKSLLSFLLFSVPGLLWTLLLLFADNNTPRKTRGRFFDNKSEIAWVIRIRETHGRSVRIAAVIV